LFFPLLVQILKNFFLPASWLSQTQSKLEKLEKTSAVLASDVMQNIREKMEANGDKSEEKPKTFIRALMDPKNGLPEREMRDEIIFLILASQEATPVVASAALLFLSMHKHVQTKVYAELRQVLGSGENIEYEQLNDLHYLEAVIKETIRLTPTPAILKSTDHEVTLSESHTIPAGVVLCILSRNTHRNRTFWGADADEFRPERFEEEPLPYSFIPFLNGPRMCIGWRYAMMFMKLTLATFLMHYEADTSLKQCEIEREFEVAVGKRGGMMSIKKRD
jgi:cytochrome P450/NADPH-cytochrome P450 reductase